MSRACSFRKACGVTIGSPALAGGAGRPAGPGCGRAGDHPVARPGPPRRELLRAAGLGATFGLPDPGLAATTRDHGPRHRPARAPAGPHRHRRRARHRPARLPHRAGVHPDRPAPAGPARPRPPRTRRPPSLRPLPRSPVGAALRRRPHPEQRPAALAPYLRDRAARPAVPLLPWRRRVRGPLGVRPLAVGPAPAGAAGLRVPVAGRWGRGVRGGDRRRLVLEAADRAAAVWPAGD